MTMYIDVAINSNLSIMVKAVQDALIEFSEKHCLVCGSLIIPKQASAIGRGDIDKKSIVMRFLSPKGGTRLRPVQNNRICSKLVSRESPEMCSMNQSYTLPFISSSGLGVVIK